MFQNGAGAGEGRLPCPVLGPPALSAGLGVQLRARVQVNRSCGAAGRLSRCGWSGPRALVDSAPLTRGFPAPGVGGVLLAGRSGRGPTALVPTEIHENVISPADMSHVAEDALRSRHSELKDRLQDISQGLDRLQRVSHQGYGAEAGEPTSPEGASGHPGARRPGQHFCCGAATPHSLPEATAAPPASLEGDRGLCSGPAPGPRGSSLVRVLGRLRVALLTQLGPRHSLPAWQVLL